MRSLILALFLPLASLAECTNGTQSVTYSGPTWASIQVTSDASWNVTRVQYGATTGYGTTQGIGQQLFRSAGIAVGTAHGLTPGTTYNAAVQVSADGGSTWCTARNVEFTTPADGGWLATLPTPPANPRVLPIVIGTPVTATTCAEIASLWSTRTPANNTLYLDTAAINAANCSSDDFPGNQLMLSNADGARGWFRPSAVDVGADTITRNSHGLSNGTLVRFAGVNNYSFGYIPLGIDPAQDYFVVGSTTNTFQISATNGGAAINLGTPPGGIIPSEIAFQSGAVPAPLYITSTTRDQLPPLGVQVTEADEALMPTIRMRGTSTNLPLMDLLPVPSGVVVRGIKFVPEAPSTANTPGGNGTGQMIRTWRSQRGGFQFLQGVIKMPALYPHRLQFTVLELNGADITVADSRFVNLASWRPWNRGVNAGFTSSTATTAAGRYYLGHKLCDVSASTYTRSGGGSSSAGARSWLTEDCGIVYQVPTGWTGTCTNCTATTADTPAWPSASGAYTTWPVGNYGTSGTAVTYAETSRSPVLQGGESGSVISASWASRILVDNNLFQECPGLTVFLSDSGHSDNTIHYPACATCDPITRPSDHQISRNVFTLTDATRQPDNSSATLRQYTNRQAIEWKDCTRCAVVGNRISGYYRSIGNAGPALTLTPAADPSSPLRSGVAMQDITVSGNYLNAAAGIVLTGRFPGGGYVGQVSDKVTISHNFLDISSLIAPYNGTNDNAAFVPNNGPQRIIFERNTVKVQNTFGTWMNPICAPIGLRANRNVIQLNDTGGFGGALANGCDSYASSPPRNTSANSSAIWTNEFVSPGYTFDSNVMVAGFGTDGVTELDNSQRATLAARQLSHTSPAGANIAARVAAASLQTDWARTVSQAAGADEDVMAAAQGRIQGDAQAIAASATSVTAWWFAPDTVGCWVDRSSDGGATWAGVVQNATGARRQTTTLTGLTSATVYRVRVRCGADVRIASPVRTP
jgi:hypothetical protein